MKLKITMKDPDGVSESIKDYLRRFVERLKEQDDSLLSNEEIKAVIESRREAVECAVRKWIEFGEYLTVEIDLEELTCRVVALQ